MLRLFRQFYPIRNIFFALGEGLAIFLSVLIACRILLGGDYWAHLNSHILPKAALIALICQTCLYYNDLYDLQIIDSFIELGIRLLQALGAAGIFLAGVYLIWPQVIIQKGVFALSLVFVIFLIVSWRFFYTFILNRGILNQPILLLGSSPLARDILSEINSKKDCGYSVAIRIYEYANGNEDKEEMDPKILRRENYDDLVYFAKQFNIKKIVVALKESRGSFPTEELLKCRFEGIQILEGTNFYEMLAGKLIVEEIKPGWLIFSDGFRKSLAVRFLKRALDIVLSIGLLILLAPVFALVAVLVKIDSKGSVFFTQERVGYNQNLYMTYKFRSMIDHAESATGPVWAKEDDPRITRVGGLIRNWRIDEIPQLWTVLKGDMSIVGPRPEREIFVKELFKMIPYYAERFYVKPGISGWAQVCYGYGASVEDAVQKLNYDLFYIKNMSIFMDLLIILRTVKIVLFGKGAR